MPEDDEEVRRLAAEWRNARDRLTELLDPPTFPIDKAAFQERFAAEEEAERAYYRLLRDTYGFNPPHGVTLDG